MCGIVAVINYSYNDQPVNLENLISIRDEMRLRGPDGAGEWLSEDKRVGLAHRRLSILDLSEAGSQPMVSDQGDLRIVFNGEIYNYEELKKNLQSKGYYFRSNSDTEVLLYLYKEYGKKMVSYLRGMYAFSIWDNRKKGLLIARDPFGIKPLYMADDGKTLFLASQVKALLKASTINTTFEPAGHVGFFLFGYVPEPYTLYKGIKAFPPGSTLWIDYEGKREFEEFCNISTEIRNGELIGEELAKKSLSRKEIHRQLKDSLIESLKHHMVADVPVGVFLSAGLDSTSILALVSEFHTQSIHTITLAFNEYKDTANDEAILAELVAEQYRTNHRTSRVSGSDFSLDLERILKSMDQPSIDGVNTYFVSKVTAESGLKVALSGLGGDELFGSYPSFKQIPKMVHYFKPTANYRLLGKGFRYLSSQLFRKFTSPKYAGLFEYGGTYEGAYLLRRALFMPWELPKFLDEEIVRKGWEELNVISRLKDTISDIKDPSLKVSALEMSWYMRNQLLRDSDWAGMSHSLEIRVPFVDINLLRQIIPLLIIDKTITKKNVASTPHNKLPQSVINRPKTGFSVPVYDWLMNGEISNEFNRGLRGWAQKIYYNQSKKTTT